MIRCPTCGTLNQDNRKSCSNCRTTLPQTKVRCPKCGTPNSVGNLFCDSCNARLVQSEGIIPSSLLSEPNSDTESSPVKGISLPTRAAANSGDMPEANEDELPDWLRGLTQDSEEFFGTAEEPTSSPEDESEESAGDSASGYPDWLSGLLDEDADFGTAEESDEPTLETQDALSLESDALPNWFVDGTLSDDEPRPDIGDDSFADLPDWLSNTADAGSAPLEEAEMPDLPDWLTASAEPVSADTPGDTELPDWLLGISDSQGFEGYPETLPTETADATPSWYEAIADGLSEPTETEPTTIQSSSEPLIFSESELPDWLTEAQALTTNSALGTEKQPEAPSRSLTEPGPSTDLPDWLSSVDDSEDFDSIELPDWLRDMPQKDFQEQAEVSPLNLSSQLHSESPGEWEETVDAEEGSGAAAVTPATGKATPTGIPGGSTVSPASTDPEPAELPGWLSGLGPGTAVTGGANIFFSDEEEPEASATEPHGKPTWLDGIEPGTKDAQTTLTTPAFVRRDAGDEEKEIAFLEDGPGEMPDWLSGLDISEPQQPYAQAAVFEGDMPARADLPGWLQELMPQSSSTAGGAANVDNATGELADADIPDWLKALRPEPSEASGVALRRAALPTAAEPEGPLEGLPGVLQAFALIDAPTDVKVTVEAAIPEAVVAQAQLWQKLLEQPRSGQRPVSHAKPRSEAAATLVRLLVAAALVFGVLGAFLLLPSGLRLATASPVQIAPGAPALIEGLNALQPGDRVIVAVEYGMAYAEEMSQIAVPVLQQMAAQQAEITFVSTSPEGAALGAALASGVDVLGTEADAQPNPLEGGYLAGNAGGISAFLSRPGAQAVRHVLVLSSQPERLRWWIEQVQLVYNHPSAPVSLSVGASASAGPLVAPYLHTLRIQGWLVGLPDALAYRELRGVEDATPAARTLDVLMLAHWAAGGLLVVGLLASLVTGKKGAR